MDDIIRQATERINSTIFGKYLLDTFPLRLTSASKYANVNDILEQTGSPACTDGKEVFVSAKIMDELLSKEYKPYDTSSIHAYNNEEWEEKSWAAMPSGVAQKLNETRKVNEVMDIILHEYTHALNEHCKLRFAAKNKSEAYQRKLSVACEIQANDGLMGRTYALNPTQQLEGVTNKRLHQETIGKHTLKEIMDALKLNENEKRGGGASQQGNIMERAAEATGNAENIKRQLAQEKGNDDSEEGKSASIGGSGEGRLNETAQEILTREVEKIGKKQVEEIMLASLSDKLRYDPSSNSVIFRDVRKRSVKHTYARPSRRVGTTQGSDFEMVRKGTKIERTKQYDKANELTVLAVDASGSMDNMQQHVAAITERLLEQVKEIANEHNINVDYNNLMALTHTRCASQPLSVTSEEWEEKMRHYVADGGNDFSCVLSAIDRRLEPAKYDKITIINISDGIDILRERDLSDEFNDMIEQGKVTWVDAIIDTTWLKDAENCVRDDFYNIRKQVIVNDSRNNDR